MFMSLSDFKKYEADKTKKKKHRNKYNAKRCEWDGLSFHSNGERDRYRDLALMEKAGMIKELKCQKRFQLIPAEPGGLRAICYVADFTYLEKDYMSGTWEPVVEDFKSPATRKRQDYKLKKRLMRLIYGVEIRETSRGGQK